MSKRKSRVWMFFEQFVNDSRKVKCNQCQVIISRGGQGKTANTTSMNNHIKYKHPTLIPQLGSAIKCSSTDDSTKSQISAEELPKAVPTPSTSASSMVSLSKKSQQNIEDSLTIHWSCEDSRSREINIAIAANPLIERQIEEWLAQEDSSGSETEDIPENFVPEQSDHNSETEQSASEDEEANTQSATGQESIQENRPSESDSDDEPLSRLDILDEILKWTNVKLSELKSKYSIENRPEIQDMDMIELYAFLGLLMYTAVFKSNHENYREERKQKDKLAAISNIFGKFVNNCQNLYNIGECATIDEILIAFRGRSYFVMYMPNKPSKYGLKMMCMCDAKANYFYNGYIYSGKGSDGQTLTSDEKKLLVPSQAVIRLTKPIHGSNRNVTFDN
ncbi:hypothetical protein HF086_012312 [Spodoptera exigua]|uniref:BED-type domain-containing protein n=1 Tax=Spodoptera exigua TaxID=7107 RepID=A0A922MU36_SPOEX|nr:hypothetical protein HF086_012312 [Spodoptera exigua]